MAKLIWKRSGRTVSKEGSTTIYHAAGTNYVIESRKRHIEHSKSKGYNGASYWDHTTYWVLKDGVELKERYSLADAKEYAEKHMDGEG